MLEADLMERDGWTRDDLLGYQKEPVRALIMHAVSRSPYYRDVLSPGAAERPRAELPTLSKATLMAEFDRVVTDPQLRLSDLRTHLGRCRPVAVIPRCVPGGDHIGYHRSSVDYCVQPLRRLLRWGNTPSSTMLGVCTPRSSSLQKPLQEYLIDFARPSSARLRQQAPGRRWSMCSQSLPWNAGRAGKSGWFDRPNGRRR
jgi:hypothetical protein